MEAPRLPAAVLAAASDRSGGALEVAATALDGLLEVAADPHLLEEAVAALEAGQPAMAPIWHLATAARGPDPRSALSALRDRLPADADAAVEAATAWLLERLTAHPGTVATVSHSSLVDRVLGRVGGGMGRAAGARESPTPRSVGPLHGRVAQAGDRGPGLSTAPTGSGTAPAAPTDPTAPAMAPVVGVVGADAIGPGGLLNADGTRELAGRVPTLVVATAVKLVPGEVFARLGGPGFEVVPLKAMAAVVVGPQLLSPAEAGRRAARLSAGL
jgi:hypothetical protein